MSSSYVDPWLDTYEDERERYPAASECQEAYEECFVDYMSEEVEGEYLDGDPFDTWIRTRMTEVQDEGHVCGVCMDMMRRKHERLRMRFWNVLPVLAGMADS